MIKCNNCGWKGSGLDGNATEEWCPDCGEDVDMVEHGIDPDTLKILIKRWNTSIETMKSQGNYNPYMVGLSNCVTELNRVLDGEIPPIDGEWKNDKP